LLRDREALGISMKQVHDPSSSYMKDRNLRGILIEELSKIAQIHFSLRLSSISKNQINYTSEVEEFMDIFSDRPLKENTGGSGFHNAFWLFLTARILNPSLIVESGVWKGHMTWLLEQACPNADILGFDIDLSRLEYQNVEARFYEYDWSEYQFEHIDPERSMIFFDCHVNHAKRILQSYNKGFTHLIFDDNPPIHILYSYGLPGFPTANMVWSGLMEIKNNEISWYWQGKEISYKINTDEIAKARALMKLHEVFPDVGGFSKYGGFSFLTYVKLQGVPKRPCT
jgi:hypothetical protein